MKQALIKHIWMFTKCRLIKSEIKVHRAKDKHDCMYD